MLLTVLQKVVSFSWILKYLSLHIYVLQCFAPFTNAIGIYRDNLTLINENVIVTQVDRMRGSLLKF